MTPSPETTSPAPRPRPRLALAIATGFGLGYLPKAPGTWGSLGGLALGWVLLWLPFQGRSDALSSKPGELAGLLLAVAALVATGGVWAAGHAARQLKANDPQVVVIDEVSGQLITLFGAPTVGRIFQMSLVGAVRVPTRLLPISWKYFLLGFILFRVFDIWKPFPVRQAENLNGGWGIMADDWIAGLYAAVGLWGAGRLGL